MIHKHLHRVLNIGIILATLLLVVGLARQYEQYKRKANRIIAVQGIDFARSKKTLLMFLQQDCSVCQQSLPFYRDLMETYPDRAAVQFVLVTPNKTRIADEYFRQAGLAFSSVRQEPTGILGVTLTPTLILADSNASVQGSWVGLLSVESQSEIRNKLTD